MSSISITCFLICLGVVLTCLRRGADVISPARVFGFIWALAIGLAQLKLSGLQHEWSMGEWIQLLVGPACFMSGLYGVYILKLGTQVLSVDRLRKEHYLEEINHSRLFKIILVLFILFNLAYFSIYFYRGEIPLFSSRPGLARLRFQMFGLGLFLHNVVPIVFFTVIYHLSAKESSWKKSILKLCSLIVVILYAITLQRFQIVLAVGLGIIFIYYTTFHIRTATVIPYMTVAMICFYWISTIRGGQLFVHYLYLESKMKFSSAYAMMTEPYMYLVMNLENYARAIAKNQDLGYGYYTFDFITALTGIKHWISQYFSLVDTPFLNSGYNTYSAFWTYYRDFGLMGITFFPFILGMVSGILYHTMMTRPTVRNISMQCLATFTIMFSFFHNLISMLWYVYNFIGIYFILRLVTIPATETRIAERP